VLSGGAAAKKSGMNQLENQVAIVTGAGRGIGQAIATRLASEGAKVAVVSRTEANSQKAAGEINAQFPGAAKAYAVDVADFKAASEVCAQILADFGRVDILVNNAGLTRDGLAMRMSENDWDLVMDTNLKAPSISPRAFCAVSSSNAADALFNISSVAGLMGNAGQTNYAASKAGLLGYTKSLAREVASRSITVNAVAPGFIVTDMTDVLPESIKTAVVANIPMAKFGEPSDIAAAVAFLAGPDAKYITGQCLTVDGGMVM